MGFLSGILKVVTSPLTIPLTALNSLGGKKASNQSVANQLATVSGQATQQVAADQAQITALQSQLNAAQVGQKNWEYGVIILALVAVVVVVVMRFRKKQTT